MVAGGRLGQKGPTTGSAGGWDCTSKRCQSRPPHRVPGNSTRPIFVHSSGIPPGCIRNPDRQPVVVPPSAPNDAPATFCQPFGLGDLSLRLAHRWSLPLCPAVPSRCVRARGAARNELYLVPVRPGVLALAVVVGIAVGKVDLCAGGGSGILAPCERDRGESLALSSSVTPKATTWQACPRCPDATPRRDRWTSCANAFRRPLSFAWRSSTKWARRPSSSGCNGWRSECAAPPSITRAPGARGAEPGGFCRSARPGQSPLPAAPGRPVHGCAGACG